MIINDYQMMIEREAQAKVIQRDIRNAEFRREALAAKRVRRGFSMRSFGRWLGQTHRLKILFSPFFRRQNAQRWVRKMEKG